VGFYLLKSFVFGAFLGLSFVPCGFMCDFIFLMSFVWSIFGLVFCVLSGFV
jgi:hypothetical protein